MRIICCPARCRGKRWPGASRPFSSRARFLRARANLRIEEEDRFVCAGLSDCRSAAIFSANCKAWTRCSAGPSSTPATNRTPIPHLYRRFHVILGDANMSPFATRLKIGTTALVLEALARNPQRTCPRPGRSAAGAGARFRATRNFAGKSTIARTAQRLQRPGRAAGILAGGEGIVRFERPGQSGARGGLGPSLDRLGNGPDALPQPAGLGGQAGAGPGIPGSAKYQRQMIRGCKAWTWNITGWISRRAFTTPGTVRRDSRRCRTRRGPARHFRAAAHARGLTCGGAASRNSPSQVVSAQWDHITLQGSRGPLKISLLNVFTPEELRTYSQAIDSARTPDDLEKIAEPVPVF